MIWSRLRPHDAVPGAQPASSRSNSVRSQSIAPAGPSGVEATGRQRPGGSLGQLAVVAGGEQKTVLAVLDELGDAADPAGEIREAASHGLEIDIPRTLLPDGGANKAIGRLHEGHDVAMGAEESDALSQGLRTNAG